MTRPSRLCLFAATLLPALAACAFASRTPGAPVRIPGYMTEGWLFIAEPVTVNGERLRMRTNTGSGPASVTPEAVQRLGLMVDTVRLPPTPVIRRERRVRSVTMPAFRGDAFIPPPAASPHAGHLIILERGTDAEPWMDGYLGNPWFARRTWTFDFQRGELWLRPPGDLPRVPAAHRVPLGFKRRRNYPVEWLPRIRVQIDGEPVDLLLSTGIDDVVSEGAMREMGLTGPSRQAMSSVKGDLFNRWRARHPEWRVIENAVDRGMYAVIEVPEVRIGGHTVGPVWFSSHGAGTEWLSNWTDRPVVGFLGANVLRHFRLTVDMERGIAVFERP
ncbi:MAG TPA: hypothetical protein VHG93_24130 [Longimicrobium sp.]|nr:hypothetical protein [Longimicrobium sp.]